MASGRRRAPQPSLRRTPARGVTQAAGRRQVAPVARAGQMMRVLVLSGPNLDRLGRREPSIYGTATLPDIHRRLEVQAKDLGVVVDCRQSNHEGDLIDWIGHAADGAADAILINPGALTHTSYALYDALRAAMLPTIEVHLSNPDAREEFRRRSRVAPACLGRVAGFGAGSYLLALVGLVEHLRTAAEARPIARAER
jgi:3-dehydroquinate dehydratase II